MISPSLSPLTTPSLRTSLCLLALAGLCSTGVPRSQKDYGAKKDYAGYKVFHVVPRTELQLEYLQHLWINDSSMTLDFWTDPGKIDRRVDIMVAPGSLDRFQKEMRTRGLDTNVMIDNVQDAIGREKEGMKFRAQLLRDSVGRFSSSSNLGIGNLRLDRYNSYSEIQRFMESAARLYPDKARVVTLQEVGDNRNWNPIRTHEGREIQLLHIGYPMSTDPSDPYGPVRRNQRRPAFWIDAGIHAREWIAPAVAIYIINELLRNYDSNPKLRQYVDNIDWYIVPVLNPDGYEYSRNSDRMWRKNRNPNNYARFNWCWGVDLNRNFDWEWGGQGSSYDECKEIYHGKNAFSEPESRAVEIFARKIRRELEGFITLHSYSQIWMYPFGHQVNNRSHDWRELSRVAKKGSDKLRSYYGTDYVVNTGANALYPASGGSDDWAKGKMGVKFVYLLELRPEDNNRFDSSRGFLLPPGEILPTCEETWGGMRVVADEVLRRGNVNPVEEGGAAAANVDPPAVRVVQPLPVVVLPQPQPPVLPVPVYPDVLPPPVVPMETFPVAVALPVVTSLAPEPETEPVCQDVESYCRWWASLGACHAWKQDMMRSCPATCGYCGTQAPQRETTPEPTPAPAPAPFVPICYDQRTDCNYWLQNRLCNWVRESCRRTCGLCFAEKSSL